MDKEDSNILIQTSTLQKDESSCAQQSIEKQIKTLAQKAGEQFDSKRAFVEFIPPKHGENSFSVQIITSNSSGREALDLFTNWLPTEIPVSSFSVNRTPFSWKNNFSFFFTEIKGVVETEEAASLLRKQAPLLHQELQLAFITSNSFLYPLNIDSNDQQLRQICIRQLLRRQQQDIPDLFEELQRFLLSTDREFKSLRSPQQLLRIVRAHHWLRKQHSLLKISNETEKQLFFRIFPTKLQYTFGSKDVISLVISLKTLSTYERFNHRHILLACQRSLSCLELIPRSFYTYHYPEDSSVSLYMEIAKDDGTLPTRSEWTKLKQELSRELINSIEQVVSRIDIPQNEEDLLRNLLLLSQQIRNTKDTPQVIIQFTGQTDDALDFHVTLVRAVKEGYDKIPSPPTSFPEIIRFIPLRVSAMDKLRYRYIKQGLHFLVQCSKKPFLRRDHSIDFLKTRESVLRYVESAFGKVRDLNGGLIYQQHQLLEGIRPLLSKEETKDLSIVEDIFHSITPSIMKNLLGPEHILTIFRQFLSLRNESKEKGTFDVQEYAKEVFVAFECPDSFTKEDILQSRSKFKLKEDELAVGHQVAEGRQFCLVICSHNDAKTRKNLVSWLEEKADNKKRGCIDQTLRISLPRPTLVLDPRIGTDRTSGTVIKMLYEGLMRLDPSGMPTHAIAEEVVVSNNARTYTFRLRPSLWSNGDPLTAYDFEYAWKKILDPSFHTIFDYLLHPILNARLVKAGRLPVDSLGVRALSDHMLVVELERPTPHFLELCCLWIYSPLCREVDKTYPGWAYYGDRTYVCNGPFRLIKWGRNSGIQLLKNELYWDKERVSLEKIDISIIEDPLQALHLFEQGKLDWLGEPLSETPMCIIKQKHPRVRSQLMSAMQWYALNVQNPPFRSAKVRNALSLALNRQKIIDECLGGQEQPAHSILPTSFSLLENRDPLSFDQEYAKKLFEEGLKEQGLTVADLQPITMILYDQEPHKSVAKTAVESWKKILGLSVNLTILGWHEFFEKLPSAHYDIWAIMWYSWYRDPMYSFELLADKTSSMNLCHWSNKQFVQLIEATKAEQEPHRRNFFLKKAEELILQEMPIIPLFNYNSLYLKNESIENIYISHLGNVDFKWARFKTSDAPVENRPPPTVIESNKKETIRLYVQGEPVSLDPRIGGDLRSQQIIRELFEGLSKTGRDGKAELALAKSVNSSADGLVHTFSLHDAQWSNGTPVTAHDFEYAWKSALDPSLSSVYNHIFFIIKNAQKAYSGKCSPDQIGVKALDNTTLKVTLEYQSPYLLELLSHAIFSPVCKAIAQKDPLWANTTSSQYVCNGPFLLKTRKAHSLILLEKNPSYWGKDTAKSKFVSFQIIEDPQTAYNLFQSKELDWYGALCGNLGLEGKSDFIQKELNAAFWLTCCVHAPHLASPKIRRALACSINRQQLCDSLLPLSEIPAYSHLPNPLSFSKKPLFSDDNVEYAQALFEQGLQELGYTKNSYPPLVISSLSDPTTKELVRNIQLHIQRTLGIRVEIAFQDWNTHIKKFAAGDFQLITLFWFPQVPNALHTLLYFKNKTTYTNTCGWENSRYQCLLESAIKSKNPQQRQKLLKNAELLLIEEMPAIPIISQTYRYIKHPTLIGEVFSPAGTLETRWLEKIDKKEIKAIATPTPAPVHNSDSTINLYLQIDPFSLDPRCGGDRRSLNVLRNVFEGLTRLNSEGKPELALAETITISDDERTYTFKLRPSKWSNGLPLVADDFAWSWKSMLDPAFPTSFAYAFFMIKNAKKARNKECSIDEVGINVLDDLTLEVCLENPSPFFLEFTALPLFAPLCRTIVEKEEIWADQASSYVSNGPFSLTKYEKGSCILLKKNPFYWDANNVPTEDVCFSIIKDPHLAYNLFKKGHLDWYGHPFGELSPEIILALDQKHDLLKKETGISFWLRCWTKAPHIASPKIRRAIACAINRKEICASLLHKSDSPAQSILPLSLSLLDKPTFEDNNIEFAQKLFESGLSELGYTKETYPPIELLFWSNSSIRGVAEIISLQLQHTLGITVKLVPKDWEPYRKALDLGLYDLGIALWYTWVSDPSYSLNSLKFSDNGINATGWENETYIRLLNLSDTTKEKEKRQKYLKQAEALVMNDLPVIPLFNQTYKFAKSATLAGELITPIGSIEIKRAFKKSRSTTSERPTKESQICKSSNMATPSTLQLYLQSEPISLDPREGSDNRSLCILKYLFEGLTRIDTDGKAVLAGAESVAVSNTNTVYTFRLRPCRWSNGQLVTAHDFVWSWKSLLDPSHPTKYSYMFFIIKNARRARMNECSLDDVGVVAIDEKTLEVELEHPSSSFLELISLSPFSPICQACDKKGSDWIQKTAPSYVSNGPYILKTHQPSRISLERNPHYWNKTETRVQKLNFPIISDPYTAYDLFQKRELDWYGNPFGEIPAEITNQLDTTHQLIKKQSGRLFRLSCFTNTPHLSSAKIRRAIACAINRQEICSSFLCDTDVPATSIIPSQLSQLEGATFEDNNPDLAVELFKEGLSELGYTNDSYPPLILTHWADPSIRLISEMISLQLQYTLGVTVTLTSYDWKSFLSNITNGKYQLALTSWYSPLKDPMYTLQAFDHNLFGFNESGWKSHEYSKLLHLANTSTSTKLRANYLKQAELLIMEELPVIPLFTETCKFVSAPQLDASVIADIESSELRRSFKK